MSDFINCAKAIIALQRETPAMEQIMEIAKLLEIHFPQKAVACFPQTEGEASALAGMAGVPMDFALDTWNKAMSRGGKDSRGLEIFSFRHYLAIEWKYQRERMATSKATDGLSAAQCISYEAERKRIEARLNFIKGQGSTDAWGVHYNAEQKAERKTLLARDNQLKSALGSSI